MAEIKNLNNDELKIQGRLRLKGSDGTLYWGASANSGRLTWDTGKVDVLGLSGQALSLGSGGTTNRLYINTSGNIGIGTTSPNHKLDIYSDTNMPLRIHRPNSALDTTEPVGIGFSHRGDSNTSTTDTRAGIFSSYNGDLFLSVDQGGRVDDNPIADAAVFIEGSNSYVGIGTTSPSYPLTVRSATGVTGVAFFDSADNHERIYIGHTNDYIERKGSEQRITFAAQGTAGFFTFQSSSTEKMRLTNDGKLGIGTSNPATKLTVQGGNIRRTHDANNYSQMGAGGSGGFINGYSGNSEKFIIRSYASSGVQASFTAGNVGIGTTSPSDKLEVYSSGADVAIRIHEDAGTHQARLHLRRGGSDWELINANDFLIEGEGTERFRIKTGTGNVGINVTNPDRQLKVNGRVTFYEYSGSWATNVADSNFQVSTLINNSAATAGSSIGSFMKISAASTGATGVFSDFRSRAYAENTTVNTDFLVNYFAEYRNYTSTSSVTLDNHAGLWVKSLGVGGSATVTNNFGVYLDVGTNATNNYGVYQIGSSVDNYFQGKVGIGTNSPAEMLDVSGNIKATKLLLGTTSTAYTLYSNGESRINNVVLQKSSNTDYLQKASAAGAFYVRNAVSGQSLYVGANASGGAFNNYMLVSGANNNITFRANNSDRMFIASNGKVGIGTTSPASHIHIGNNDPVIQIGTLNTSTGNAALKMFSKNDGTSNAYTIQYTKGTGADRLDFIDGGGTAKISFNNGGAVGIGTTDPEAYANSADNLVVRSSGDTGITIATTNSSKETNLYFSDGTTGDARHKGGFLYKHESDYLAILVNGSEKMRIASDGKVGIGTTSSSYKLDVSGEVRADAYRIDLSATTQRALSSTGTDSLQVGDAGVNDIKFKNASGTSFIINSSGNVGIGTVSPAQKLHVEGHILLENNYEIRQKDSGGSQRTILELNSSNDLNIGGSYAGVTKFIGGGSYVERMRIHSDGNIGVNTNNPLAKFQVGPGTSNGGSGTAMIGGNSTGIVNALSLVNTTGNDTGRGVRLSFHNRNSWSATGAIQTIQTNSTDAALVLMTYGSSSLTEKMRITSDGKVGIGTTSPSQKLQVDGGIYSNGEHLYVNSGYGVTAVGDLVFRTYDSSYIERARIKDDGKFGIGINSPDSKVHIEQSKATINTTNLDNGTAVGLHITYPDTTLTGGEGIALAMGMNGRGRSYIANISPTTNKDASDIAFYTETGGVIGEKLRIKETGNVGVGTTSPSQKLHVAGNIKTTGWIGSGSSNYITFDDTNNRIDFYANGVHVARMEADGDLHIKGDVIAFSDIF